MFVLPGAVTVLGRTGSPEQMFAAGKVVASFPGFDFELIANLLLCLWMSKSKTGSLQWGFQLT